MINEYHPWQELRMQMIKFLYGSHYHLYPFFITPDDIGHTAVSRARVYIIMVHRERVEMVIDPYPLYEKIRETITRLIYTRPRDYLIASDNEIMMDAADVARGRKRPMTVPWTLPKTYIMFFVLFKCSTV